MTDPRRHTPRADLVLADPRLRAAERTLGRGLVRAAVAQALDGVRRGDVPPPEAADAAVAALPAHAASLRGVVNATGVLVHTNLGRAPLSAAALAAVGVAAGYTDVELDLRDGRRARRGAGARAALLAAVPEAEDAHVVNNNAAALALVAAALAAGGEALVSRGELIEIGDGFRIPDLLAAAGARLREVGTTNRTRPADYADAVGPETALILKLHPSNFVISGFTGQVPVAELARLGVPVVYDIGSGLLAPEPLLPDEPDANSALRAGAALVTGSGDKLLGGPQAGIMLGRADLVERVRRHPLARAMRVDKLTLAALEATVRGPVPPVVSSLRAPVATLRERAERLAAALRAGTVVDGTVLDGPVVDGTVLDGPPPDGAERPPGPGTSGVDPLQAGRLTRVDAVAVDSEATVGGGGAPGVVLPSAAVSLPARYAAALRRGDPPVLARVTGDRCLLDLRAVPPEADATLLAAVRTAASPVDLGHIVVS